MPANLIAQTSNKLPARYASSENDVFLLIKGFISENHLVQPPLVVWPGQRAQECSDALLKIARNDCSSILA